MSIPNETPENNVHDFDSNDEVNPYLAPDARVTAPGDLSEGLTLETLALRTLAFVNSLIFTVSGVGLIIGSVMATYEFGFLLGGSLSIAGVCAVITGEFLSDLLRSMASGTNNSQEARKQLFYGWLGLLGLISVSFSAVFFVLWLFSLWMHSTLMME